MTDIQLIKGDCLVEMQNIPEESIKEDNVEKPSEL